MCVAIAAGPRGACLQALEGLQPCSEGKSLSHFRGELPLGGTLMATRPSAVIKIFCLPCASYSLPRPGRACPVSKFRIVTTGMMMASAAQLRLGGVAPAARRWWPLAGPGSGGPAAPGAPLLRYHGRRRVRVRAGPAPAAGRGRGAASLSEPQERLKRYDLVSAFQMLL